MKFPRERRLTESAEFREVRRSRRSRAGNFLVMGVSTGHGDTPARFGIITTKKVGNAVLRSRIRRRIRGIIQECGDAVPTGARIVVIARRGAATAPASKLRGEWRWLARKLLGEAPPPA